MRDVTTDQRAGVESVCCGRGTTGTHPLGARPRRVLAAGAPGPRVLGHRVDRGRTWPRGSAAAAAAAEGDGVTEVENLLAAPIPRRPRDWPPRVPEAPSTPPVRASGGCGPGRGRTSPACTTRISR
ncbi:hypothetical protein QJS66_06030 [Kocuria rhizophila]|nr:hypothetical protein QJS66_06030 [Kocuria rhizophila]